MRSIETTARLETSHHWRHQISDKQQLIFASRRPLHIRADDDNVRMRISDRTT